MLRKINFYQGNLQLHKFVCKLNFDNDAFL